MIYDAVVVGGGIAGLTAAAFIAKAGKSVLVCEKENTCGGLVNSFTRDGFVYDGGIRALENSGVLFPMLKALGIELDVVKNHISIGIENQVIRLSHENSVAEYHTLLDAMYPEAKAEIDQIILAIRKIMGYMEVQYGIDNPIFLDFKKDREYLVKVILPWVIKYAVTAPKISKLDEPVVDYLKRFTSNAGLLDIISQHFFRDTPAFFALSYLTLYEDYHYPMGGTGTVVKKLVSFIEAHKGEIRTNTSIVRVDPAEQVVYDDSGNAYAYKRLIWAADQKLFYRILKHETLMNVQLNREIDARQTEIEDKAGNDSVLTVFLGVELPKEYFSGISSEHFFYTPKTTGQTQAGKIPLNASREEIEAWLRKFFALTTYEISCPVMRDASLAPDGNTGLIVSVLFDYRLTKYIESMGWYEDFKLLCETLIVDTLDASIYPGMKKAVLHKFSSTPLTMEKYTNNTDGAITGWALYNHPIPAESRIPKIANAVKTPVPNVYQAGQWTYSPAGLPVSILTGKLAADQTIKDLK